MREDTIDPSGHRAQPLHGALLNVEPAGKVLVAVEQGSGTMEGVEGVV